MNGGYDQNGGGAYKVLVIAEELWGTDMKESFLVRTVAAGGSPCSGGWCSTCAHTGSTSLNGASKTKAEGVKVGGGEGVWGEWERGNGSGYD